MRHRRHSNTIGDRQVRRGRTRDQVRAMAARLGVPAFAVPPRTHEQWATISPPDAYSRGHWQLCLWGDRVSAVEGCDPDERVCLVRIEVIEVLEAGAPR